jgi:hypothetical protein
MAQPEANLGLLLGDIVDVEGDTEQADATLNDLIGNYPHPRWRSSKSTHHLFVNPDARLTSTRFLGMEFRGHKHQSVLPPSVHENGLQYSWQEIHFPIPEMPAPLLEFYRNNRPRYGRRKKKPREGFVKTQCGKCKLQEEIHKKRLVLEVKAFAELGFSWQCHACRSVDVRDACRRIRTSLRRVFPIDVPEQRSKKNAGKRHVLVG